MNEGLILVAAADSGDRTAACALVDWLYENGLPNTARLTHSGMCRLRMETGDRGPPIIAVEEGGEGGNYGSGDGGYGYGYGNCGDGGYGYGDGGRGDGDGYGGGDGSWTLTEGVCMKSGFAIIVNPGGFSPCVRIGWVVREDDWVRILNCRVIRRFGAAAQLTILASSGPLESTVTLDLCPEEGCHIGQVSRWIPANPDSWPTCPKPEIV